MDNVFQSLQDGFFVVAVEFFLKERAVYFNVDSTILGAFQGSA